MRALLAVVLVAASGCNCLGIITSPGFEPVGTAEIPDAPKCPHRVPAAEPTAQWTRAGPQGASVHALLPLGGGVLLVGTGLARSSGVMVSRTSAIYRSADDGRTVSKVLDLPGASVEALVEADGVVLAGVSADMTGGGVWSSSDRGVSFAPASTGLHTDARVAWLSVAAGTPARVYALVRGTPMAPASAATTLYRKDGTGDWQLLAAAGLNPDPGGPVGALVADLAQRDRLYVADGARLYRSDDAGATFTIIADRFYGPPSGTGNPTRLRMPSTGRLLVATNEVGLLETTDEGVTFNALLPGTLDTYPRVLDVAPQGAGLLVATDGQGLVRVGDAAPAGDCLLDKVVVAVASSGNTVWTGTNGGVQRSTDGAGHFETAGEGLDELLGRFSVATIGGEPTAFLMSSAGLYRYTHAGAAWERQGDWANTVGFSDLSVSADGKLGFLSVDEELFPGRYGVTGSVWLWKLEEHLVSRLRGIEANVGAVAADPKQPGRAFAFQRGETPKPFTGVLVNGDGAPFVPSSLASESLSTSTAFRFSPLAVAGDGTVYSGARLADGSPALLRSDDGGATKVQVWNQPGWVTYGVFVDPMGAVLLTGSQGGVAIRRSTDRGVTFAPFDAGLTGWGKWVYALAMVPGGGLLAGTEGGVRLAADGVTFSALDEGFGAAAPPVWAVAVLPASPKPIAFAATARGVFWRTLP